MPIYKYEINLNNLDRNGQIKIAMPEGAELLTVQDQRGNICLWAIVHPDKLVETRTIEVVGTGCNFSTPRDYKYISTVQLMDGALVLHFFEVLA